jgi:apolipoprotein N-acyltransferase
MRSTSGFQPITTSIYSLFAENYMRNEKFSNVILAAVAILTFSMLSPKWVIPAVAWVAPALLITLLDRYKPAKSFFIGWLVLFLSGLIANYKVMPFPLAFMIILTAQVSFVSAVPFLSNRLLKQKSDTFLFTLIFPAAAVTIEYLNSFQGSGSWGAMGYTQSEQLPLIQLASLTGLWGVSFIVYWTSAIIVWVYKKEFHWQELRSGLTVYVAVMLTVYFFGVIRINPYFQAKNKTVRAAGITAWNLQPIVVMYQDAFQKEIHVDAETLTQTSPELQELNKALVEFIANPFDKKFRNTHAALNQFQDSLFKKAEREARAGAVLISFSEALMFTVKPIEDSLIHKGERFAKNNHVYLMLTIGSFIPGKVEFGSKFIENKSLLIGPDGQILNTFFKNKPVPIVEGSIAGDGIVPVTATKHGRIATSICYDADYPSLTRQTGENKADILVLPSGDWKEISPYHANMARMRAIENGFSMLRTASGATSIACDYYGRVISSSNFYDDNDKVLLCYLPTSGITTMYSQVGDVFAWLCGFFILFATVRTLVVSKKITTRKKEDTIG